MPSAPVLEFRNVARSFRPETPVLVDVSFSIRPGEVVGLLGRNGTGKTTLVRIAMGLLNPHAGSVAAFGLDPMEEPVKVKRRIGFVAEDQVFPAYSTVGELLAFHRMVFPNWDDALKDELLDRFALGRNVMIHMLSKGKARQVALICAMAHRPDLLILDEPAGGLDPYARRELLEAAIQSLADQGSAILFSTHHMTDLERIATRVVLMEHGRVKLDSSLRRLREEICVARIPVSAAPDPASLLALAGCLDVHQVENEYYAVFEGTQDAVAGRLREALPEAGAVPCAPVPLEDLFIELVGRS